LEVFPPAPHVPAPGIPQLVAGSALAAAPHLPHLRFDALNRSTLSGFTPIRFSRSSRKPRNLRSRDPRRPALGGVHLQSQTLQVLHSRPSTGRASLATSLSLIYSRASIRGHQVIQNRCKSGPLSVPLCPFNYAQSDRSAYSGATRRPCQSS
jgi:hypothetical protein